MPTLLLQPGNPYLESDVFAWSTEPSRAERNDHTSSHTSAEDYQAQFRIPYHAAELIEPRIDATKPSKWTVVSSDDNLLRALLKAYFQYEYPVYPFFHKDFFLEDMISGKEDHCSRLLVNAILATACRGCSNVINGAAYWHPESLQYRFAAEARRIRDIEVGPDGPDGLTTIQGGLVMSLSYNMNGIDKAGWSYLSNAVNMAQTLKLFDLPPGSIEQKMRAARAFTSWAVFCYQSTFCFHYFQTPLVRHPPRDVMPDPSQAPHWYPETWLLYPPNKNPIRACHAHYIKVVCDFRVILNDIGAAAFPNEKEQKRISVPQTFVFYARLKQWFNNLPVSLTVKRVVLPFQLLVHLHYFNILLSIFEPFLGGSEAIETETVSQPLQIDEETPESIVLHSRIQLETVWRLYYLRHGFDFFDPLLPQFHILLGFMGWRQLSKSNLSRGTTRLTTPEHTQLARSTVVLAAKGLYEHSKNCYLSETMFHIFRDSLDTENLQLLNQFVYMSDNQDEMARGVIAQQVHSQFPVNIVSIAEDPKDHRLDEMIAAYKYLDFEEDN